MSYKIYLVAPKQDDDISTKITLGWAIELGKWLETHSSVDLLTFFDKKAIRKNIIQTLEAVDGHDKVSQ